MRLFVLLFIVLTLTTLEANCQSLDHFKDPFVNITVDDGLSQNAVHSFYQDKFGFMWIGTRGGLNRYDGTEVKSFIQYKNNPNTLSNNSIWDMEFDQNNKYLWIGTTIGLNRYSYDNDTFDRFYFDESNLSNPKNKINSILILDSVKILVGTDSGLIIFNIDTQKYQKEALLPVRVFSIEKFDNNLYISTQEGLFIYNLQLEEISKLDKSNCDCIPEVGVNTSYLLNGSIYIGTVKGFAVIDLETRKCAEIQYKGKTTGYVSNIVKGKNNELWISASFLFKYQNDELELIENPNLMDIEFIGATVGYVDNANNLWVGTNGYGAFFYSTNRIPFYYLGNESLSWVYFFRDHVKAIYTKNDTVLWTASVKGITQIDKAKQTYNHIYLGESVLDIIAKKNEDWGYIGGSVGLRKINFKTGEISILNNSKYFGVWDLEFYGDNTLLIAVANTGPALYSIKENSLKYLEFPEVLQGAVVKNIDGDIWLGTQNQGILVFDGSQFKGAL